MIYKTNRTYRTEGVVLKGFNLGEADKILTIFTKHYGKIKVRAPGVRRITSRKAGNLELFNQVRIFVARGKTFDVLTEVEIINSFEKVRKDLKKISLFYYFAELVDRLTGEEQENQAVYELLVSAFGKITQGDSLRKVAIDFQKKILEILGFGVPESEDFKVLQVFIENIIERGLSTPLIFRKVLQ